MNEMSQASAPVLKPVQLARFREGELLENCLILLRSNGIAFRVESTAPIFDVMTIGHASTGGEAVVFVAQCQLAKARGIALADARESVQSIPPEESAYLATLDTGTLQKILEEADGWSFYDLAVAEYLLDKRGAEVPEVHFATEAADFKEHAPVRARWQIILIGALLTGGIMGIVIGFSLMISRQNGKDSPPHYDKFSRTFGLLIFILTLIAWTVCGSLLWRTMISLKEHRPTNPNHYHRG